MTLSELFTQGDLTLAGVLIATASLGILAGFPLGRLDSRRGRKLAPEPPVYRFATPPRAVLYDQDESPFQRDLRAALADDHEPRSYVAPRVEADDGEVLSEGSGTPGAGVLILPRALLDQGDVKLVKFHPRGDD